MVKTFNFITIIFIFHFLISCGKEDYIGPPIEAQFGELIIQEPFSSDKPVGVDFSLNDTVRFFSEFSISANFNINISGRNSGANFSISELEITCQMFFGPVILIIYFLSSMSGVM